MRWAYSALCSIFVLAAVPRRCKRPGGRVGYAADRVLFYFTGGAAFGNIQAGFTGFDNNMKAG
jgi:hypothetical protein